MTGLTLALTGEIRPSAPAVTLMVCNPKPPGLCSALAPAPSPPRPIAAPFLLLFHNRKRIEQFRFSLLIYRIGIDLDGLSRYGNPAERRFAGLTQFVE